MRRLVRKSNEVDNFLGKPIEIIYPKSKFLGFRGWIDTKLINDKYKLMLPPADYEHTEREHIFYVDQTDIYKWVKVLQPIANQKKEDK